MRVIVYVFRAPMVISPMASSMVGTTRVIFLVRNGGLTCSDDVKKEIICVRSHLAPNDERH